MPLNLTNPAVVDPQTGEATYGALPLIIKKLAMLSQKTAQPDTVQVDTSVPEAPVPPASPGRDLQTGEPDAGTQPPAVDPPASTFSTPPTAPQPQIMHPSFQQATSDPFGNVSSAAAQPPHSLTKLGFLAKILRGGVQGGLDAVSGGALDAVPGRSGFGAGVEAAQNVPLIRAGRHLALAGQNAQTQLEEAQAANYPTTFKYGIFKTLADIDAKRAEAGKDTAQAGKDTAEAGRVPGQIAGDQAELALKNAQTSAAKYKDVDGVLYDVSGGTPTPVQGAGTFVPADEAMAKVAGIPVGTKLPLTVASKLKTVSDAGIKTVQANGRSLLVDSAGRTIKDLGSATPIVVNQLNNGPLAGTGGVDSQGGAVDPQLKAAVDSVGNYQVPLNTFLSRVPPAGKVKFLNALTSAYPNFDEKSYDAARAMLKDFASPSGKAGGSILAFNTALSHMGLLNQAAHAMDNNQYPLVNQIGNKLSLQLGDSKVSNFNAIKTYLGGELAKAFGGGIATDSSRSEAEDILSSYQSPEQIHGMLQTAGNLLKGKLNALEDFHQRVTGKPLDKTLVSPESQQVLKDIGVPTEGGSTGGGAFNWNAHPVVQGGK